MSKSAKLPNLSGQTKLFSFDLETNGLHGQAFAIGAVVINTSGEVIDQFSARCPIDGTLDPWVKLNVLPAIEDLAVNNDNYPSMREAFWRWYLLAEAQCDYVVLSNGYPVEYKFLLDCQQASLEERYWQHPFPILDLASLLTQVGGLNRVKSRLSSNTKIESLVAHNPLNDAYATALYALEAFRLSGALSS